ncbi:CRISPR-associated endonuclease Cas1 [Paucidesulfovibrio longus]|uniref:CRISPR-associated endonuclease Cas1 n=1 Tax=Paucidesulfovibrio longus TaxID=889 RepID=UPI0009DB794A|nr:CRISPR-associated endonuclease Cas1 [Paucidesulfovibrio longus]
MPVLYVTEPGATVRLSGESLLVTVEEHHEEAHGAGRRKTLLEVESHRLELISIVGAGHITSTAMQHCLERGISVAWLTRSGEFLGRTIGAMPRSAEIRLRQYAATSNVGTRLERAVSVVNAKLRNAHAVLLDIQSNDSGNDTLRQALTEVKRIAEHTDSCKEIKSLLGSEGSGARAYFAAFGAAFKSEIPFRGRKHRPAPDPANSLLSFGYVILGARLAGLLEARGLDPYLGFFHELRPGRPSLALDLLEELRHPIVDRFVLRNCNLRVFRPEHFDPPDEDGAVRMNREGLRVFFSHWENHLLKPLREHGQEERISPHDLIRRQVERFAASLGGGELYRPFLYGN